MQALWEEKWDREGQSGRWQEFSVAGVGWVGGTVVDDEARSEDRALRVTDLHHVR